MNTRIQNWTYKGGYTRRTVDLTVSEDGSIKHKESEVVLPVPDGVAGGAIIIKSEGWNVFQELRLQAKVTPADAPLVVATVGGLQEAEDKIITPQVRSIARNVGGSSITVKSTVEFEGAKTELATLQARLDLLEDPEATVENLKPEQREVEASELSRRIADFDLPDPDQESTRRTKALDFQDHREVLEGIVAEKVTTAAIDSGITLVSVTFGNTDLPPELLLARKVEQLSQQLLRTFVQKRIAQTQRQATEAAKARADEQPDLVKARIAVEKSELLIEQQTNEGEAQKAYDISAAEGREALANVLGADRVFLIQLAERALSTLERNPEILGNLKLPATVSVSNGGGDLSAVGAILSGTKLLGGPATAAE